MPGLGCVKTCNVNVCTSLQALGRIQDEGQATKKSTSAMSAEYGLNANSDAAVAERVAY